ncbi:hypothetical protein QQG55_47065 [Brugia pahangi]
MHKVLFTKQSVEETKQYETFSGEIPCKHAGTIHSISKEPQKPDSLLPGLHHGKQLIKKRNVKKKRI